MAQTLFVIPAEFYGLPVFGFGLLFWAWLAIGGYVLFRQWQVAGFNVDTQTHLGVFLVFALLIGIGSPKLVEQSGGIPIRGFGAMVLLGIVAGNWLAARQAQWMGVDPEVIFNLSLWLFVAGFLGARTFYVIEYWHEYAKPGITTGELIASLLNIAQGGIVLYGSVIGVLIALVGFSYWYRAPMLALADLIAPAIVLGYAFGRLGCLMNGCCFGDSCEFPWAVRFPEGSPPFVRQVEDGRPPWLAGMKLEQRDGKVAIADVARGSNAALAGLAAGDAILSVNGIDATAAEFNVALVDGVTREAFMNSGTNVAQVRLVTEKHPAGVVLALPRTSLPIHPTQIYSSINAFFLSLFLWAFYPYRRRDGEVFGLMLTIYPVSRFLIEWIRVDETGAFGTPFSISQLVSLGLLGGMAFYWIWLSRRPRGSVLPPPGAGREATTAAMGADA